MAQMRIGVLKSIGFTPGQVAASYIAQIGAPAIVGVTLGTVVGNLWVAPMLNISAGLFKAGTQHVLMWINVAVPAGMSALAGLAARLDSSLIKISSVANLGQGQVETGLAKGSSQQALTLAQSRQIVAAIRAQPRWTSTPSSSRRSACA